LALTDILHSLNNARRYFYNFELPLGFSQTIQLNMVHQMVENGFIRKMPRTWVELYHIAFYFQDYLNWLKRKLPANDPRVAQADEMLAKGGGLLSPLRYLNVFPVSLTKPYIYPLLFTKYGLQRLTSLYREFPYDHERVRRVGARYDLTRLAF